jgi:hypothetical protein
MKKTLSPIKALHLKLETIRLLATQNLVYANGGDRPTNTSDPCTGVQGCTVTHGPTTKP